MRNVTANVTIAIVYASDVWVRFQPNSRSSGARNTLHAYSDPSARFISTPPSTTRQRFMTASQKNGEASFQRIRKRQDTLEEEFLDAPAIFDLRRVEIALRVGRELVNDVELAGPDARPSERIERLEGLAVENPDTRGTAAGDVQEALLRVGR